jgi:hypothetical protein
MNETQLKKACVEYLALRGAKIERTNAGSPRNGIKGCKAGTADLLGCWHGRAIAIETKASHKDNCKCPSCTAQRDWRKAWERAGGLYVFVRSLLDLEAAMRPVVAP